MLSILLLKTGIDKPQNKLIFQIEAFYWLELEPPFYYLPID